MQTTHRVIHQSAARMAALADESVHLVVTSPPYPMIEMWDGVFGRQNPQIQNALEHGDGPAAFEAMHRALDPVWRESWRVLVPGGIAAVNIGDATRTLNQCFALYANHARILAAALDIGFSALPAILWRKQTNAPNKFMGSGMMPPGAYVTLEHETVLLLRKGDKRLFRGEKEKRVRRESAYFWEERNHWFSDVWMDLKGARQSLFDARTRKRSAAFPFELPYRLISMFSVKGDTVLDPFLGIGTTMYAAMAAGRNSVGYEIDPALGEPIGSRVSGIVAHANARIRRRLEDHLAFVRERTAARGPLKHRNRPYGFPVVTRQESDLLINPLKTVEALGNGTFRVAYSAGPQPDFAGTDGEASVDGKGEGPPRTGRRGKKRGASGQIGLFDD